MHISCLFDIPFCLYNIVYNIIYNIFCLYNIVYNIIYNIFCLYNIVYNIIYNIFCLYNIVLVLPKYICEVFELKQLIGNLEVMQVTTNNNNKQWELLGAAGGEIEFPSRTQQVSS